MSASQLNSSAQANPPSVSKLVLVAGVALINASGKILLAQRPEGKPMSGLWEFPGGKVLRLCSISCVSLSGPMMSTKISSGHLCGLVKRPPAPGANVRVPYRHTPVFRPSVRAIPLSHFPWT
uniref:8-oxo-dGTP diphosphatase n=1 Tax=Tetraselmis sp. GSL018 TaxID=582737 RepID=A0A061RNK4_9CHLO